MQGVLRLAGVETERIAFKRRTIANGTEMIQNIYAAGGDLDRETRLKLNPMISQEDIPGIMQRLAEEETAGLPSAKTLTEE